jgi:hypothetical protein
LAAESNYKAPNFTRNSSYIEKPTRTQNVKMIEFIVNYLKRRQMISMMVKRSRKIKILTAK